MNDEIGVIDILFFLIDKIIRLKFAFVIKNNLK